MYKNMKYSESFRAESGLLKYFKFPFQLYVSGNLFYEDISTNPSPFFAVKIGTLKTRGRRWKDYTLEKQKSEVNT